MIRQFTIIPTLLGIAALVISACSAEVGGGKSNVAGVKLDENATGNSSVATSVSIGIFIRIFMCWQVRFGKCVLAGTPARSDA